MTWVVNRSAAYLADAAALARAQWAQFSPTAMLAGLGLFLAALLLHLRCAWAVAAHTDTHTATQGPADRGGASQAEATVLTLGGIEWAALAVTLACAGAMFSANAIMAEGGLATCMVVLLAFALAMHSPPLPPEQLQLPWQLLSAPLQAASRAKGTAGTGGAKQHGALWCWGSASWSAVGLAVSAAVGAAAGNERRTLTDAMHKATAKGAGRSLAWLAGLTAWLGVPNPMKTLSSNPAFSAVLRAFSAVAALMLLLRLQALFTAEHGHVENTRSWSVARCARTAARATLCAEHACAGLHLALAVPIGAALLSAPSGFPPKQSDAAMPAALRPFTASLQAALAALQGCGHGLLLPQLTYAFSAAALALLVCSSGLACARALPAKQARKFPRRSSPAPGGGAAGRRRPREVELAHTDTDPDPTPGSTPGYLLSGCVSALLAPAMVVLGADRAPSLAIALLESACALAVIRARGRHADPEGACCGTYGGCGGGCASAAGVLWALLGTQLFFSSGHFCEFAGLQVAAGAPRVCACVSMLPLYQHQSNAASHVCAPCAFVMYVCRTLKVQSITGPWFCRVVDGPTYCCPYMHRPLTKDAKCALGQGVMHKQQTQISAGCSCAAAPGVQA